MGHAGIGLGRALEEMGPNHLTDFADSLTIDGHPKPQKGHFPMWEDIGSFREAFTDFLGGIEHAFIGGVAARSHGARRTPTIDYDVLVPRKRLQETTAFLERLGGKLAGTVESTYTFRMEFLGFDVDVRVADSPLDREALQEAETADFKGRKLKIAAVNHLVAMKVKAYAGRKGGEGGEQDKRDVIGYLALPKASLESVRDILRRHRPDLLPELDEIRKTA